jgi:Holliday junction resolvase RusA-like endonuclease
VAKGNISRNRAGASYDRTKGLRAWTDSIHVECRRARGPDRDRVMCGQVAVRLVFYLPRPKRMRRPAPTVKPDLDKLARAVLDALSGVAYEDDAQVCHLVATKHYADEYGEVHCRVTVYEIDEPYDLDAYTTRED